MYSCGPLHMAEKRQGNQLEPTYSSSVKIQYVAMKTYRKRWTIGRGGERGSGISVLMAWQDDDDDICREREKLSLLLCLRDRQLRYLAGAVFLSYSMFQRVKLLLKKLLFLERFIFLFSCLWVWTLDLFSHLTIKTSIFIEDSLGRKHSRLANQSQIILYTFTTFWQVSQSNASVGRVSLPRIRFRLVIQSNHNIGTWLIMDPRPQLMGKYFFSL